MCGIAGIIENTASVDRRLFSKMIGEISHRGPESEGVWFSEENNVILGHRRLAIIDLSPGGQQPMTSDDGRFIITFNGEIYNYQDLKAELMGDGCVFKTQSDTEVLLQSYARWGEECLTKLNGMFAFAIWDIKEKRLFAARDRLGEKPFKYYASPDKFIFASEIKAILADPAVERKVDWQSIDEALSFRFVSSPATGFVGVKKLPAGHFLIWQHNTVSVQQYWGVETETNKNSYASVSELKNELWNLFLDSVKKRLISDVPIGAFLSGGLDSTSVVAAVKELGRKEIDTFVISMEGESEDQRYARQAAQYFGTNHHEIALHDINYQQALENLVAHYDEPFFDQSALPSMLISEEIKKYVTVVLSGDGGDELFGGYDAYAKLKHMRLFSDLPVGLKKFISTAFLPISNSVAYKAEVLAKDNIIDAYTEYYALWKTSLPSSRRYITKADLYTPEFKNKIDKDYCWRKMSGWFGSGSDLVNNAMIADIRGRLADGYLTKTDIATMCSAVELRPPFLDYRLVELSARMPGKLKIKNGIVKWLWKETVKNKMPESIVNRKKIGFAIPLHDIMQKQLKTMVEDTVLVSSSHIANIFSVQTIRKLWQDHLDKRADYSNHIWSLLILELWLKKYLEK